MRTRGIALLATAAVLAIAGQIFLGQGRGWPGAVLYTIAAASFAVGVSATDRPQGNSAPTVQAPWPEEAKNSLVAAGLFSLLAVILLDINHISATVWLLQLAAILSVVIAGRFADRQRPAAGPLPQSPIDLTTATSQVLLALIIIGGIWVRFDDLGSLPRGFWFDEADAGLLARRISTGGERPLFGGQVPAYDAYLIALLSNVFGEGVATVRAVSAFFGLLMIPAGYLVGRELFGKTGGLVVAFLLAFSRWAITLSRIGMNNVTLPLFSLLALGLMMRGYRRQSNLDMAAAGMAAGAGMLFYPAIASSLLAFAGFGFYLSRKAERPPRQALTHVLFAVVGAIVIVAPLAKFAVLDSDRYFKRNRATSLWSDAGLLEGDTVWSALRKSLSRYLPMTSFAGDRNGRHNIPGEPMLPPVVSGLSLLGLGTVAWRVDRWLTVLAGMWLPLAFAPGVLSLPWEAPNTLRAVGVLPVAIVIATAAIFALAGSVVSSTRSKHVMLATITLALAVTGWLDVSSYFDANRSRGDVWAAHSTPDTIAVELNAAAPASTYVAAVSFLGNSRQRQYLTPDINFDAFFGSETPLPLYVPAGEDALLLTSRDAYDIAGQAELLYPNATVQYEFDGLTSDLIVVRIPASDLAASLGWTPTGQNAFQAALLVDEPGGYQFRFPGGGQLSELDGYDLTACQGTPQIRLAAGLHLITVEAEQLPEPEWRTPGSPSWEPVPGERIVQRDYVPGGLVAKHFADPESLIPDLVEIDASLDLRMHVLVLPRPYRSEWTGGLVVPETGEYELAIRTDDELTLRIDDDIVATNGSDFAEQTVVVSLERGTHPIALTYIDRDGRSEVVVRWRMVGDEQEPRPIPAESFIPWIEARPLINC